MLQCVCAWLPDLAACLHVCLPPWLPGCLAAWLPGCLAAWPPDCPVARLPGCPVVRRRPIAARPSSLAPPFHPHPSPPRLFPSHIATLAAVAVSVVSGLAVGANGWVVGGCCTWPPIASLSVRAVVWGHRFPCGVSAFRLGSMLSVWVTACRLGSPPAVWVHRLPFGVTAGCLLGNCCLIVLCCLVAVPGDA